MKRHPRLLQTGCVIASLLVSACGIQSQNSTEGTTRTYYIAADEVVWNYVPGDLNRLTGEPFEPLLAPFVESGPLFIGRRYKKALYREYTDDTFTTLKERPAEWEHLGSQGPLVRAEVGDTIRFVFKNNVAFPASVHPHGVFYDKDSEGAPYADRTGGGDKADDGVPPGATHVYEWPVPERAGPGANDGNSILWMYHSHVDEEGEVNAGLIGPMIVHAAGTMQADGKPEGIDREFVVAFAEYDENMSLYFEDNIDTYAGDPESLKGMYPRLPDGTLFGACNFFTDLSCAANFTETMNGFSFGYTPGLTMRVGERVRWYLMATTNFEVHAPHWHGNTVEMAGMRTDVTSLTTMGMAVADMVPDNPGTWLFHCHVGPHLRAGMQAVYTVEGEAPTTD